MPGVREFDEKYFEWFGCPHCEDESAEGRGFYFKARELGDANRGRYCAVCKEFISMKDVEEWLRENDFPTWRELKDMKEEAEEEVE